MTDLAGATLGQLSVVAHDVERATIFYRDALGLPFLFQYPGLAFFKCGEVRLMISQPEQAEYDHPGAVMYFKVPDVEASYATLVGRGVAFIDQPHVVHRTTQYELWMAFFQDTEGNPAALMGEKPVVAAA